MPNLHIQFDNRCIATRITIQAKGIQGSKRKGQKPGSKRQAISSMGDLLNNIIVLSQFPSETHFIPEVWRIRHLLSKLRHYPFRSFPSQVSICVDGAGVCDRCSWAAKEKLPNRIVLFYSNRRPEDAPFLAELQALERDNPKYKLIVSMTEMEKSHLSWKGETGLINQEMLEKHLKDAASPIYSIAGPPAMVKGLHEMLSKTGIRHDNIHAEEFAGY